MQPKQLPLVNKVSIRRIYALINSIAKNSLLQASEIKSLIKDVCEVDHLTSLTQRQANEVIIALIKENQKIENT